MFRGEWLVVVDAADPANPEHSVQAQMWVDERDVRRLEGKPERGRPVNGWLRVEWADTRQGLALVVLPQPAQPLGESLLIREHLVEREAEARSFAITTSKQPSRRGG